MVVHWKRNRQNCIITVFDRLPGGDPYPGEVWYTQRGSEGNLHPRCLIVDGHSSHVEWRVVKYALAHNIHMICLPSKSTHLLQPLDVGCFSLLQTTYEHNLCTWVRTNPLLAISKVHFLDILQETRKQVFT